MVEEPTPEPEGTSVTPALHASALYCDVCGKITPHRILHIQRKAGEAGKVSPRTVRGVARCRVCDSVHPFSTRPPAKSVDVLEVVSEGPLSQKRRVSLPFGRRLQVGSGVPGSDVPVIVRAIDRKDGRRVSEARAEEIVTIWTEREKPPIVRVSVIEGRRTSTTTIPAREDPMFEVGQTVMVHGVELTVMALRARGQSWRRPGDHFRASEIQRLYARRAFSPPAGSRDWRTVRDSPVSRTSSSSRSERSRSSPGVRRKRTVPRARTAD